MFSFKDLLLKKLPWILSYATSLVILLAGLLWLVGCVNTTKQDAEYLVAAWFFIAAIYPTAASVWYWLSDNYVESDQAFVKIAAVTLIDIIAVMGLINDLGLFNYSAGGSSFNCGLFSFGALVIIFSNAISWLVYDGAIDKLARIIQAKR
jgi:hypothetical membrane protein